MIYLGYLFGFVVTVLVVSISFSFYIKFKEKKLQLRIVEAYNASNYAEMREAVIALEKMDSKVLLTLDITAKEQQEAEDAGISILVDSTFVGMMQIAGVVMPDRLPCHISSIEK
tara:strand:- start:882 stop:1223 length:342 start_codon:yes stop_codon:yes gene_type:complete